MSRTTRNKSKTACSRRKGQRIRLRLLTFALALAMVATSGAFCFAAEGPAAAMAQDPAGTPMTQAGGAGTGGTAQDGTSPGGTVQDGTAQDGSTQDGTADLGQSAPGEGAAPAVSGEPEPAGGSAEDQTADDDAIRETVAESVTVEAAGPEEQAEASSSKSGKTAAIAADRSKAKYTANPCKDRSEVRGLWIAFSDFKALGLYNVNEATYTANLKKVLDEAKKYGVNTVYFHVRSMDNAGWRSKHFPAIEDLDSDAKRTKSAYDTYAYDPLKIAIREAHAKGMELHAWMNPYRISYNYFLDPADAKSLERVLLAVDEVLELGVDGVHFDDYFYHAKKGYKHCTDPTAVSGKIANTVYKAPAASTKRTNVNKLVKQVYNTVHGYEGKAFGISPAGNWENCMAAGADVKTWLSKTGYVDYLAPQIYWTNQWGSSGKTTMFNDRLALFKEKDTADIPLYAGLALYRTGYTQSDDKGWGWSDKNLAKQLAKLRSAGYAGWILFSSQNLAMSRCKAELRNFHFAIYPVKLKDYNYPTTLKKGQRYSVKGQITTSATKIKTVKATIIKKSTGKVVTGHSYTSGTVNEKTFDLSEAAPALKFHTLSPGTYYYRVTVTDSKSLTKTVMKREFKVKWPFTASITGAKIPGSTLTHGRAFTIKGTLKTSIPMRRVEIGIVKRSTGKWVYHYDNKSVNKKTFDVHRADGRMKFRSLAKGKYYYRIIIHTDKGTRRLVNKAFTVK